METNPILIIPLLAPWEMENDCFESAPMSRNKGSHSCQTIGKSVRMNGTQDAIETRIRADNFRSELRNLPRNDQSQRSSFTSGGKKARPDDNRIRKLWLQIRGQTEKENPLTNRTNSPRQVFARVAQCVSC